MSEWFSVQDRLPDPNTEVEVMFNYTADVWARTAWPCVFHPEGSSPPMFVFRSWMDEPLPSSTCRGGIIAWRYRK